MREGMFADRTCVVSGVGPGVGRAVALAFAVEGGNVVLGARSERYLAEVAADVRDAGSEAVSAVTDITDARHCQKLIARAVESYGGVDVLVNNAAYRSGKQPVEVEHTDFDDWQRMFAVNLFGTLQVTQCAIPAMRERGGGAVVFVNTMMIRKVRPSRADYISSRSALLGASQTLAREVGPDGIRVNSVVPGWIWGPHVMKLAETAAEERDKTVQDFYDEVAAQTALGRLPTPEDVADAILFLASDKAKAITGQTLDVNGGEVFV